MVKTADINPRFGVVAGLAAERRSIGALLRHAILELSLVRIHVTGSAGTFIEVERENFVGSSAEAGFVTFRAGYGHVRAGQLKSSVLVLGNRECRAMEILYRVAIFAAVLVGRGGELLVVSVLVTIGAGRELHFVESVFAGRRVAFVAGDGDMFTLERIVRRRMFLHAE